PAAKALVSLNEINPSSSGSDESLYKLLLLDKLDSTMAQDAKVNESIYNMLLNRLEQAKISQRLEASKQGTRYTVLDPPRLPLKPIKPNKILTVIIGLFLGTSVGFGLVLLAEFTDHSFLGIDEAKEALDLPLLGGISKILTEEDIAVNRARSRFRLAVFTFASLILIVMSTVFSLIRK
ncbi:MAG: GNVR domain-containing protein, partial [Candidatus Omnitrophota bacterium]